MSEARVDLKQLSSNQAILNISGQWSIRKGLLNVSELVANLKDSEIKTLTCSGKHLEDWDSALVSYLVSLSAETEALSIQLAFQSLPEGVVSLVRLAQAVPKRPGTEKIIHKYDLQERVGRRVLSDWKSFSDFTAFLGESLLAAGRFMRGKSIYRLEDLKIFLKDSGPASLGIVSLISVLIGMILAFVGAVQLEKFGASIYVASLVGLAMAREMAAMMTAIIMAGRTGAAYAAQLGSMQVNEEIDALKTMGISPFDFLVMPRMVALVLMMPLLTIYANLMGILGGGLVSVMMLDLTWSMYWEQMIKTVPLYHFGIGLFKSLLFGILVALSGCYMGINSGRSATAVGQATTSAVVVGIVLIIVCDSLVTIVTTVLGV